jgi:hypothetical protein
MSLIERCALALALDLGYVSDEREWNSEDELNEYDRTRAMRMAEIVLDTANHQGAVSLSDDERHILRQWGCAIRELDGERFSDEERALLDRLEGRHGMSNIGRDHDRLVAIHALLDPPGTSLKSIEELIATLVEGRDAADRQLAGAVGERDSWKAEAHRLRTLMAEAAKQDPAACQRWIKDGLASAQWGQS